MFLLSEVDPKTLVFALGFGEFFTAIAMVMFLFLFLQRKEQALLWWVVSKAFIGLGLLSLFYRQGFESTSLSVVLTNTLIILGHLALVYAGRVFWEEQQAFLSSRIMLTLSVIGIFCFSATLFWTFAEPQVMKRTIVTSSFYALCSWVYGIHFYLHYKKALLRGERCPSSLAIACLMGLNGLFHSYFSLSLLGVSTGGTYFDLPVVSIQFLWFFAFFIGLAHYIAVIGACFEKQQQALRKALKKAEHLRAEKQKLIYTLIHEFRNPVTMIDRSMQLFLMTANGALKPEQEQRLEEVRSKASQLHLLMDHVLVDSTDLEKEEDPMRSLDVALMQQRIFQSLSEPLERHRLQIYADELEGQEIVCYPNKLVIALNNLVANALRYSPEGSPVELWIERKNGTVSFVVENRGQSLSEDELNQVRMQFFRGENTEGQDGLGLGLSVVQWVAERHSGYFELKGLGGEGTRAVLTIPQ
ncbi:sensor histidine kinase [Kiloniella sp. b19]|uniref:sensor histidine kinase n=1 Tax=Kiloniella sp. GXU_MW_B19 TaxID=3141326 RepID=UPI0031D3D41E